MILRAVPWIVHEPTRLASISTMKLRKRYFRNIHIRIFSMCEFIMKCDVSNQNFYFLLWFAPDVPLDLCRSLFLLSTGERRVE